MNDLISRQAAIEELSTQDVYTEQDVRTAYVDGYSDGIHRGYEDAVRNYKNLALKRCEKGKSDDLISRQEALKGFAEHSDGWCYINALPPAEPAEIIRCKDCKWFRKAGCAILIQDELDEPEEDDFCSFAERRTDD